MGKTQPTGQIQPTKGFCPTLKRVPRSHPTQAKGAAWAVVRAPGPGAQQGWDSVGAKLVSWQL